MPGLKIKIDSEVYKLRDSKVSALLSGNLTVEAFALLIRPGDPYVLISSTIYALTESEFYALRQDPQAPALPEDEFKRIVQMDDLSFMSQSDALFMRKVRDDLPKCPACRYRRYRNMVLQLTKKYGIKVREAQAPAKMPDYPDTTGEIVSKVTSLLSGIYKIPAAERKPCMDCVEKHLAQAWVLSNEAMQGYPEYVAMVVGHLGEAIAEMPDKMEGFRDALMLCLAKTRRDNRPFVPMHLLLPLVYAGRKSLSLDAPNPEDDVMPIDATLMQLELTDEMKEELHALPASCLQDIRLRCDTICKIIPEVENPGDLAAVRWEGAMGVLADTLAQQAPKTANMIRSRRLMFKADPRLSDESGYGLADISECVSELEN